MTIPVWKKGLGLQKIYNVRICHEGLWAKKHLESLKSAYSKAPFLDEHLGFLEKIFLSDTEKLIHFNLSIIRYLLKQFQINTEAMLLSDLGIEGKGSQLLVGICEKMGTNHFLAQAPVKKFLDTNVFQDAGIEIEFFNPPSLVYPQLWGDFIPNLSALDLVLNCGSKARDILLKYK